MSETPTLRWITRPTMPGDVVRECLERAERPRRLGLEPDELDGGRGGHHHSAPPSINALAASQRSA